LLHRERRESAESTEILTFSTLSLNNLPADKNSPHLSLKTFELPTPQSASDPA